MMLKTPQRFATVILTCFCLVPLLSNDLITENSSTDQKLAASTPPPTTSNVEVCDGETVPSLTVSGTSIKWYDSDDITSLHDSRDGKTYQIVRLGDQVWMAENLNYGSRINSTISQKDNGTVEKYCLANSDSKCSTYGGLYQWDEMMNYGSVPESQGVCPSGWHLPSHEEWQQMEISLGMDPTEADDLGLRGTIEGKLLQVNGGSGFDALMAGKRSPDGSLPNEGTYTTFWTSTPYYNRTLSTSFTEVYASKSDDKAHGFSVRCVMNDPIPIATGNTYSPAVSGAGTYTYYVSQTVGGVESERVPITLTIHPSAQVNISGDSKGCTGEQVTLDAGAGYSSYKWNTNATSRTISVSNSGTFEVTVTDNNGCKATDKHQVEFHPLPQVSITGDTEGCEGESVELDAGSGFLIYNWSTGATGRKISVTESGTYSVTVADLNGCENSDDLTVTFSLCIDNFKPSIQNQVFSIEENTELGTEIGTLVASDQDVGQVLKFKILSGNTNNAIKLNGESGVLSVNAPDQFNHEEIPQFLLEVEVQDNGIGQLTDTAMVTVNVQDVNEPPLMEDQFFQVEENAKQGTLVGVVFAEQEDEGQTLQYQILYGNTDDAFHIDPATGTITVWNQDALDKEKSPEFYLVVRVSDNASTPLFVDAIITISLNATSITNRSFSKLTVFPNPTDGTFFVRMEEIPYQHVIIEVYDTSGRLAKKVSYGNTNRMNAGMIDITLPNKGVYYLKINCNGTCSTQKIICY